MAQAKLTRGREAQYSDVVGVDVGGPGTRLVRVARRGEDVEITAMEELPTIRLPLESGESCDFMLKVPKLLAAPYAAFAVVHPQSVLRLVPLKQLPVANEEEAITEMFGAAPPQGFRIGFSEVSLGGGPAGTYLACAVPDFVAEAVAALLPEARKPAPASLQVAASARLSAFALGPAKHRAADGIAHIHVEGASTSVAVFNQGHLSAYRQFPVGNDAVVDEVARQFGLPQDLAGALLLENQIDTSSATTPVLKPLFRQIGLSLEFVARRESCRIEQVFLSGTIAGTARWLTMGEQTLSVETKPWNPVEDHPRREGLVLETSEDLEPGYDAALGAALALLESE